MSRGFRLAAALAAAVSVAVIPACNRGGSANKPQIAVVTNCVAEFWSICEAGAKKAAAEKDVGLVFKMPDKMEVASQKPIIDAFDKQGVAGIAVSVIDPKEQTPDLKQLSARVPLVAMDNDAPDSGRVCYVGISNYDAGKAVGRMIKEALPDGGTVALFIGATTSANAQARVGGVVDELAGHKDAKGEQLGKYKYYQAEPLTDGGDEAVAQTKAKGVLEALRDTPNLCLVGLYAYNPKAIVLAAREKGLVGKVKIAGFDEDDVTLDGIAKGEILGTVVQDPFQYGYRSVEVLAAYARGDKSLATDSPIPYRLVTKDGGPEKKVDGTTVANLKVGDFAAKLKADLASAKK